MRLRTVAAAPMARQPRRVLRPLSEEQSRGTVRAVGEKSRRSLRLEGGRHLGRQRRRESQHGGRQVGHCAAHCASAAFAHDDFGVIRCCRARCLVDLYRSGARSGPVMGRHARHLTNSFGRVHVHRMVMPASRHRSGAVVMPAGTVQHRRRGKPLHGKCKGQQPDDEYADQSGHAAQFSPRRFLCAARGSQGAIDNSVITMLPPWLMARKLTASPTLAAASCSGEATRNTSVGRQTPRRLICSPSTA